MKFRKNKDKIYQITKEGLKELKGRKKRKSIKSTKKYGILVDYNVNLYNYKNNDDSENKKENIMRGKKWN